jgi:hypothetical protein
MSKRTLTHTATATAAALVASLALVACGDRRDENANLNDLPPTAAGDTATSTTSPTPPMTGSETTAEQRAREVQADAANGMDRAADGAREAGRDVADATRDMADRAGNKVNDAVITTAVNTELAKDSALSSLKIDVDTSGGRVMLKGTAPSQAARDRATQIASSVNGVVSVDNQLRVETQRGS